MWSVCLQAYGVAPSTLPIQGADGFMVHHLYTTSELIDWLRGNRPARKLSQWHIHHTWDPSYADFNWGNHAELQQEMKYLHVVGNGWDDIGQHFTLFPDGSWMLGRSIERDPASIRGWNQGAMAVEMVGNFDLGHDRMTDFQKGAILTMSRFMVHQWHLQPRFHRDNPNTGKTCPGTSLNRESFMHLIDETDVAVAATLPDFQR